MDLKPITREGTPAALEKAERYRLLNDSSAAESICLDVLEIDPANQQALVTLLLSITDQFGEELSEGVRRARDKGRAGGHQLFHGIDGIIHRAPGIGLALETEGRRW